MTIWLYDWIKFLQLNLKLYLPTSPNKHIEFSALSIILIIYVPFLYTLIIFVVKLESVGKYLVVKLDFVPLAMI